MNHWQLKFFSYVYYRKWDYPSILKADLQAIKHSVMMFKNQQKVEWHMSYILILNITGGIYFNQTMKKFWKYKPYQSSDVSSGKRCPYRNFIAGKTVHNSKNRGSIWLKSFKCNIIKPLSFMRCTRTPWPPLFPIFLPTQYID